MAMVVGAESARSVALSAAESRVALTMPCCLSVDGQEKKIQEASERFGGIDVG